MMNLTSRNQFESQFRLFIIFSFMFLGILWIHSKNLEKDGRLAAADAAKARLVLAAQNIVMERSFHSRRAMDDSYALHSLAERHGLSRVVLMDAGGAVLADSRGALSKGESVSRIGLPADLPGRTGPSTAFYYGPWISSSREPAMFYLFRLAGAREGAGRVLGIELPIFLDPYQRAAGVSGLMLKIFGFIGLLVFLYFLVKSLTTGKAVDEKESAGEPTGLMIDSFHDLIGRLKQKEQELEGLRKVAEDRAAAMETYNDDILRSVSSGVITFDLDRQVTTFNNAAERILGVESRNAVGRSCDDVFGPSNRISGLLDVSLNTQAAMARQEFELRRRDGESICVGVSTSLLRDREERLRGATVVFTDLTEIKRLQEQVELRRRLTVLGEMSAGIAHEFRNYMGTVMGFAKLLSRKMERDDPRQEMAAAIIRELESMDRLIKDLLGFGRQEEVNLKAAELEPLIRRLVAQTMAHSGEARPKVSLHFDRGLPRVALDEVLFPQAFSNLVQNAIESMGGGGELSVRVMAPQRPDAPDGREIELAIADTGVGIPRENLERIFLPFFTTKEKGTGLGLALAHKIILSHGGRIVLESVEGKGTTFRIFLPAAAAGIEAAVVRKE